MFLIRSTMGNKQFRRLEDFWRHKAQLEAECANCGHKGTLDAYSLFRWFGIHNWNSAIEEVAQHMRCKVCRRRPTSIRPTPANPDPSDFFPKGEDEWKRKVRQLRG